MDVLFYPETTMQTASQSSTYPFNIKRSKEYAERMNNMLFNIYYFTGFTVTFYRPFLYHQQNSLDPCKLIILIPHDNISLRSIQSMTKHTSVVSTPLTRCLFGINC